MLSGMLRKTGKSHLQKKKIGYHSLFRFNNSVMYIDRLSLTAELSEQKADDKLNSGEKVGSTRIKDVRAKIF